MIQRSNVRSLYMEFAKLHSGAKYNLATSGVMGYPLRELPVRIEELEINGPSYYGYQPLIDRIARKNGVAAECVVYTMGTSMANQLAFAACTEPGDEILTETPGYELIDAALRFLAWRSAIISGASKMAIAWIRPRSSATSRPGRS